MAKKMLVDVLERRLREVLVPRDPEAHPIHVDLRGGVVRMKDCRFNAEYLSRHTTLRQPFTVSDSIIRSAELRFSLRALLARQHIELQLEGVALVLAPRADLPIEEARAIFRSEKQQAIIAAELWSAHARSMEGTSEAEAGSAGRGSVKAFVRRVAQAALVNAVVSVRHVHVRYECETEPGRWSACGVLMRSLGPAPGEAEAHGAERDGHDGHPAPDAAKVGSRRERGRRGKEREEEARDMRRTFRLEHLALYCEVERRQARP
jgi:hypothetical protein